MMDILKRLFATPKRRPDPIKRLELLMESLLYMYSETYCDDTNSWVPRRKERMKKPSWYDVWGKHATILPIQQDYVKELAWVHSRYNRPVQQKKLEKAARQHEALSDIILHTKTMLVYNYSKIKKFDMDDLKMSGTKDIYLRLKDEYEKIDELLRKETRERRKAFKMRTFKLAYGEKITLAEWLKAVEVKEMLKDRVKIYKKRNEWRVRDLVDRARYMLSLY